VIGRGRRAKVITVGILGLVVTQPRAPHRDARAGVPTCAGPGITLSIR
jgi:hypothetical protein